MLTTKIQNPKMVLLILLHHGYNGIKGTVGGGIKMAEEKYMELTFHKCIKNTSTCGTILTEYLTEH